MTAYDESLITCERTAPPPRWYTRRGPADLHEIIGAPSAHTVLHVGKMFFDMRMDTAAIAENLKLPESTVYRALIMFRQQREKGIAP